MRIDVVTLFPEFFEGPLKVGLVGRALADSGVFGTVDPRQFTADAHRTVDDSPYGGGAGMVMKADPLVAAIDSAKERGRGPVVLLSPQGTPLTQAHLQRWSGHEQLVLVCGRYEGFDDRIRRHVDEEVSLGDFVLTGGEAAALAIIDGVVRLLPGTLGNAESIATDSFAEGLLEHPHFTRPLEFQGTEVPAVLRSGNHPEVARWRRAEALKRTQARRPELLHGVDLNLEDTRTLAFNAPPAKIHLAVELNGDPGDSEQLKRLRALAHAYRLASLTLVGADLRTQLSLPPAVELAPPGTKKRDRAQASAAWPLDILYEPNWAHWLAREERTPNRPRLGVFRRPYPNPPLWRGPVDACSVALGPSLNPESVSHRLGPLLPATPAARLDVVTAAAISLDRLLGPG